MTDYAYHLLDVFTETKLAGNQLAVVPEAAGLDERRMQAVAREFNLSETVFLSPPTRPEALFTVRIFTPGSEMEFAGHPTIGTTVLLAHLGHLPTSGGKGSAILDLPAGPVPVTIANGFASLQAPKPPVILGTFNADAMASAVGLAPEQVEGGLRLATAGNPFAFLQVGSQAELDALVPDHAAIIRYTPSPATGLTVFAKVDANEYAVRMFAPQDRIFEDPATGSSAAAMAALLLEDDPSCDGRTILIRQGVKMGRPSEILLTPSRQEDGTPVARVAGKAVIVAEGRLFL
ncbi:MAG TPA: PhzF family phenazine biosynthesis protein [Geminicoccus sp.]|jgi:trans-2,3-dihydro-3-hydroxyanthranilate isomerase|uniref:PhzF family phenazine biosynthesis protein n=1 Tax=Geminicoccus sp. TaxID=2024832 RepID=UPI002E304D29|nr:PhzF family phenazine biosynthesis protein [Geminicoccus sp.]HEX2526849.1 PhzF family phenazine biosynthesis protein [Geminicoccus sp.]